MAEDRKRMKRVREKRINAMDEQIKEHEKKIHEEKGIKDTTKAYWQKEIDKKFRKQKKEDKEYLEENE